MINKQKAFVILTPGFAASENDTTCLPMQQELLKAISNLYAHIELIILSFQYPYVEKSYQWFGITVYSFNGKNKGGIARLLLRKKVTAILNKINKEKQIIGLLSFWLNECAAVGKSFGEKYSIPHYCWIFGQDARKENKYPKRLAVQSKELIALSDFLQEEVGRNHGVRACKVIPPGIELRSFKVQRRDIDLLVVGSLIPLKQVEIFIEIVLKMKQSFANIKALIIGDGPEKEKLGKLISDVGLKKNISIAGELPYFEVLKRMHQSKILVHPSSYEGFSGVCLEALCNGAHVVSFCKAMNKDIDHWHIVNNKEEMEQRVLQLLQQQIDHNLIVPFLMKDTVQQLMGLYHQTYAEQLSLSNDSINALAF
jgi:glycosyltransferase involved in cell wall biosynthesis